MMNIKNYLIIFLFFFYTTEALPEINLKYLSLKNSKVNVRIAPSRTSPIKWIYEKKSFPVIIVDQYYNWRKIKDFENDSGWVHISQLSRKRSVLFIEDDVLIFKKPTAFSRPLYKIEKLQVALIKKCSLNWCSIKNNLFSGWVEKNSLWGLNKNEIMN